MTKPLDQFTRNLDRSRDLLGMHIALKVTVTPALDISDILRAGIVMAVSALDHLIHELVLDGMLSIISGGRPATEAFSRFDVSVASTQQAMSDPSVHTWLEYEIRSRHGWVSFQQPDKIADAIRLISDTSLWKAVGLLLAERPVRAAVPDDALALPRRLARPGGGADAVRLHGQRRASFRRGLNFNDWIPLDSASWAALEQVLR